MITQFHVSLDLRIDWSELDLFGHVNNVAYFKYIQAARVNYWDYIGLNKMYSETNIGPMLVSVNCQLKKPLYFPGNIKIFSGTEFIKNTSFCLNHRILDNQNEIVAEASDIIVIYDYNSHLKVPFPPTLKQNIANLENSGF